MIKWKKIAAGVYRTYDKKHYAVRLGRESWRWWTEDPATSTADFPFLRIIKTQVSLRGAMSSQKSQQLVMFVKKSS